MRVGKEVVRVLQVWKQERGVSLWELLVAVSILATLAIAFTGAGTAYFSWHRQDVLENQEVLLAEQKLDQAKQIVESGGTLTAAQLSGTTADRYSWQIITTPHVLDGADNPSLTDLKITIRYGATNANGFSVPPYTLQTTARMREAT